jgi:ABC-type transport system substrate-binding protein
MRWTHAARRAFWLLAAWLVAGCPALPDGPRYLGAGNATPRRGGVLMLGEEARVRTLDPPEATDTISGSVVQMLFEGLYAYDDDMNIVPRVASALPEQSDDGLLFTVPLRADVRFSHGRLVTADDVAYSLERLLDKRTGSAAAAMFSAIEGFDAFRAQKAAHLTGVRVLDGQHVQIRLTRPDQSFLHLLAMHVAAPVPREIVEQLGSEFAHHPVGTGAFVLSSWDPGVRVVLKRNALYFRKGLPYLDGVVRDEGVSTDTGFLRFRNGEQDIVLRVAPPDRALLEGPKWRPFVTTSPGVDVWALFMNCEIAPFDNVHVRRAVAFAIDRERWARARNGSLAPTGQMLPPRFVGYDAHLPHLQRFDLALAREEMRLAGFPDGLPETVLLWTSDQPKGRVYGALAQADLEKIGIHVELKPVSFPIYLAATAKRGAVQMFAGGWTMDYPDPSSFLNVLHSRGIAAEHSYNKAFYSNPELDGLLDRGLVERNPEQRARIYHEANDLVAKDAPWAFFANQSVPNAWQPYVKNFRPHPAYWTPINEVWLDLPKKRITALESHRYERLAMFSPLGLLP